MPAGGGPLEMLESLDSLRLHGHEVQLAIQPSTRACENLSSAFNALRNLDCHVVCLEMQSSPRGGITNSEALVLEVPPNVLAAVAIGILSRKSVIEDFLRDFVSASRGKLPVVVLCVDEGQPFDQEEALDAQSSFIHLGASDLVLQRTEGDDLLLDITLCVQRAQHTQNMTRFCIQKTMEAHQRRSFWPFVHRVMPGFPELQMDLNPIEKLSTLLCQTGMGAFGKVFQCREMATGALEALKVIPKSILQSSDILNLWNEITFLQDLAHPNIVKLKTAIHTPDHIFLLMDFAGKKTLFAYMAASNYKIETCEVIEFNRQIIAGIAYCHRAGVAHRDLKPENIMIDGEGIHDGQSVILRIVDFGCAVSSTLACSDMCGTVPFIAPEVVCRPEGEHYIPTSVDMWAYGIIYLEMLCGIGKLKRMLHWSRVPGDYLEYGRKLKSFFANTSDVLAAIEDDIGPSGSANFPERSKESLLGMLTLCPATRWNANQVELNI